MDRNVRELECMEMFFIPGTLLYYSVMALTLTSYLDEGHTVIKVNKSLNLRSYLSKKEECLCSIRDVYLVPWLVQSLLQRPLVLFGRSAHTSINLAASHTQFALLSKPPCLYSWYHSLLK